jgi:hypothetical protein
MTNVLHNEEVELSTEINEEEIKLLKTRVHVLLHFWKCNFGLKH